VLIGWLFRALPVLLHASPPVVYFLALIGHVLLGFGIPFLASTPSTIAENWFAEHQRLIAVTIVSMGNLFGLMLSYLSVEKLLSLGVDIGMQVSYFWY
jgi:MFS family permease